MCIKKILSFLMTFLFIGLTSNTFALTINDTAILVIDPQADFTTAHNGSLAVPDTGNDYIAKLQQTTEAFKAASFKVYATQDWHPADHVSFAINHPGKQPFEVIDINGIKQILWPSHCVQHTNGARLVLKNNLFTAVIQKGMNKNFDSYSGFQDQGNNKTNLEQTLRDAKINNLVIYGLAADYCVKASVEDAIKAGFKVIVVKDLTLGINAETIQQDWENMQSEGAIIVPTLDVKSLQEMKI